MVAITQTAAERVSEGVDGLYRTLCPVAPASKKRGRRKVKRRAPSVRVARGSVSAGVGVVHYKSTAAPDRMQFDPNQRRVLIKGAPRG